MDSKPSATPTEGFIKEMLAFWSASGRQSFSLEEALEWCETHHPEINPNRFSALLRTAAANRKRKRNHPSRTQPVADLLWQLTPARFIPYNPTTDPAPGSSDAAAWVIQLALQERDDVERADTLGQYCARLATAVDALKAPGDKLQEKAEGLADLVRSDKLESFLSQVSELSAAHYFQATYPIGFQNHVENPGHTTTGPAKNFDFSFQADGVRFNVEVKAFSKPYDGRSKGGTKYFLPESVKQQMHDDGVKITANLSPTLGRFLLDANAQLFRRDDDLNVALICCNDPDEYADVFESLHGPFGIIRSSRVAGDGQTLANSVIPNISLLTNIDAVVVCQIGFLHAAIVNTHRFNRAYGEEGLRLSEPAVAWDFRHAFPSGFWLHHPPAESKRELTLHKAFNSHTRILLDYHKQHGCWQQAVFSLINHSAS